MKLTKKAKKGFTLVELIVVIAIIAILAAVSVAGYYGFIASANQSAADQEAAQVKNVIRVAATQGVNPDEQGKIKVGDNEVAVTTSYTWTLKGLEAGAAESTGDSGVNYLADLVNIANAFGGLALEAKADAATATANKAGLQAVTKDASITDANIITSVTYVSAKKITSIIYFTK